MFYLLLPSLEDRQAMIDHLKARGILSVFHYLPLHLSDMGRQFGGELGDCPVTEDVSDRLVRLPFYNNLGEVDQAKVVEAILEFAPRAHHFPLPLTMSQDGRQFKDQTTAFGSVS
jgi:dTDP-4-amino-4,6-dideoxygalactose transaminase